MGEELTGDAVVLQWQDLAAPEVGWHNRPDAWSIAEWTTGRGGEIGVAVEVRGVYAERTEAIRRATRSWRNRFARFFQHSPSVPLCAVGHISWAVDRDRRIVQMLCALAVHRPDIRPGLADDARVRRLISDLARSPFDVRGRKVTFRRTTTEIITAMHLLGYEHRFHGRPLPDDPLAPVDEIVSEVIERVRANPYANGVHVDRAEVERMVRRNYLDVEPWPVGALL